MAFYIQLSFLRINRTHPIVFTLALGLCVAACGAEPPPPVSRVWPVMGTMLSVAAWAADSTRLAGALNGARDSVNRIDSLLTHHARIAALDSAQRDLLRRTGVTAASESLASGYALDRAARALGGVSDSALLDLGGQYLWVGPPGRMTNRTVGIPDPENSLDALGWVELRGGSIRTQPQSREHHGRARSVTVLAPDALTAHAWSIAFFALGCDSALAIAAGGGAGGGTREQLSVVCADSAGVRWTRDLETRVRVPAASGRAP